MRAFKSKEFHKWAKKEGLSDGLLLEALEEIERGLVDADLGGGILKKRVSLGHGKRGGARTVLAYKKNDRAFFVYGFAKNVRSNIKENELKGLKAYARELLKLSDRDLNKAVNSKALIELSWEVT